VLPCRTIALRRVELIRTGAERPVDAGLLPGDITNHHRLDRRDGELEAARRESVSGSSFLASAAAQSSRDATELELTRTRSFFQSLVRVTPPRRDQQTAWRPGYSLMCWLTAQCVLGYALAPILLASIVSTLVHNLFVRIPVSLACWAWSVWGECDGTRPTSTTVRRSASVWVFHTPLPGSNHCLRSGRWLSIFCCRRAPSCGPDFTPQRP
jgi:hypothetical protein